MPHELHELVGGARIEGPGVRAGWVHGAYEVDKSDDEFVHLHALVVKLGP